MKYLAIFAVLLGVVILANNTRKNDVSEIEYASQKKQMGEVEVEVLPLQLYSGAPVVFELSLDTHSVDLDYDFRKISNLKDNFGNNYNVVEWGGGSGGHHLKGELTFEKLKGNVGSIVLNLDSIGGIKEKFKWQIGGDENEI